MAESGLAKHYKRAIEKSLCPHHYANFDSLHRKWDVFSHLLHGASSAQIEFLNHVFEGGLTRVTGKRWGRFHQFVHDEFGGRFLFFCKDWGCYAAGCIDMCPACLRRTRPPPGFKFPEDIQLCPIEPMYDTDEESVDDYVRARAKEEQEIDDAKFVAASKKHDYYGIFAGSSEEEDAELRSREEEEDAELRANEDQQQQQQQQHQHQQQHQQQQHQQQQLPRRSPRFQTRRRSERLKLAAAKKI